MQKKIKSSSSQKNKDYISLAQAEKYCPYSGDYLKLRARKGKLRAIKIGRNWVTTKEWVKEYAGQMEGYKEERKVKTQKVQKIQKVQVQEVKSTPARKRLFRIPVRIPAHTLKILVVTLLITFMVSIIIFVRGALYSALEDIGTAMQITAEVVEENVLIGKSKISNTLSIFQDLTKITTQEVFGGYKEWMLGQFSSLKIGTNRFMASLFWVEAPQSKSENVSSNSGLKGVVLYDEDTGQPYCLKIKGGMIIILKEMCENK